MSNSRSDYFSDEERIILLNEIGKENPIFSDLELIPVLNEKWSKVPRLINSKDNFNPDNIYRKHREALLRSQELRKSNAELTGLEEYDAFFGLIEISHSISKVIEHGKADKVHWFNLTMFYNFPAEVHLFILTQTQPKSQKLFFQTILMGYAKNAQYNRVFAELKKFIDILLRCVPKSFIRLMNDLEFEEKPYCTYRKLSKMLPFKIIDSVIHTSPRLRADTMTELLINNLYTIFDESFVLKMLKINKESTMENLQLFYQSADTKREEFKSMLMNEHVLEEMKDNFVHYEVDTNTTTPGGEQK